ncbi:MAG: anthranilate synthase component I family protein [Kiritimatiellae bacterium]|nr:anthranilate synthase component I family protein [Kiritimatiellia bacterium]
MSKEEYAALAAGGRRVPVFREFLADRETPVAVLTRASEDENAFLLESVWGGERRGRYSFLGVDPVALVEQRGGQVTRRRLPDGAEEALPGDILSALRGVLDEKPFARVEGLPPLQGGAIGFLSYDAVAGFEPRTGAKNEPGTPEAAFMLTDTIVVFDGARQTATVVAVADDANGGWEAAQARIDAVYARLLSAESIARWGEAHPAPAPGTPRPRIGEFRAETTEAEFRAVVERCKDAIRAGECIQIVPSRKFEAETDMDALSLYRALRLVNPSPYNFFLKLAGRTLIGSSPEELVSLRGRRAATSPIAGTRPRGATGAEDRANEADLLADAKERAEHLMLVDLGRNDLGRVCEPGTVKVDDLARVERYSHVMHLVSDVSGLLEPGRDGFDLLRAAFPAGTLTGAPKVRAMQLIADLEASPRGVYGGALGYFSATGDIDFAIVIRTLELRGRTLSLRTGAGIVADSDPERELQETLNKARALFAAARYAEELQ